jgi:hypothetical protein
MKRKYKDIRVSKENWEALTELATKRDTYNSVITKLLEKAREGKENV